MTEYEKLEYLHHIIQECMSENNSCTPYMLEKALEFVEDIREQYFDKDGNIKPLKLL